MPLPVYGDGQQMRDYQYVLDHVSGVDRVLHAGALGEVYNIGTGKEITNLAMVEILLDAVGKPRSLIQHVEDRAGHDRRYCMNVDKLLALGWEPAYTHAEAIRETVRWYVENRWWWEPIRSGEFKEYYQRLYGSRQVLDPVEGYRRSAAIPGAKPVLAAKDGGAPGRPVNAKSTTLKHPANKLLPHSGELALLRTNRLSIKVDSDEQKRGNDVHVTCGDRTPRLQTLMPLRWRWNPSAACRSRQNTHRSFPPGWAMKRKTKRSWCGTAPMPKCRIPSWTIGAIDRRAAGRAQARGATELTPLAPAPRNSLRQCLRYAAPFPFAGRRNVQSVCQGRGRLKQRDGSC